MNQGQASFQTERSPKGAPQASPFRLWHGFGHSRAAKLLIRVKPGISASSSDCLAAKLLHTFQAHGCADDMSLYSERASFYLCSCHTLGNVLRQLGQIECRPCPKWSLGELKLGEPKMRRGRREKPLKPLKTHYRLFGVPPHPPSRDDRFAIGFPSLVNRNEYSMDSMESTCQTPKAYLLWRQAQNLLFPRWVLTTVDLAGL